MAGHHFHPRRNVETVQPSQVKCRLNDLEEGKDDFDVALRIPQMNGLTAWQAVKSRP